jgi:MFS family permease
MILFPASAAYVSELAPRSRRGEYMGFYSMSFGLGFALGPWLGLATYESLGATGLWLACLAVGAVSTALLLRVRSDSPAPAVDAPLPDEVVG